MPPLPPVRLVALAMAGTLAVILADPPAMAFEAETDLSMSRDFVYGTVDARLSLADDVLTLGAGAELVGDWRHARGGMRAAAEVDRERYAAGAMLAWAPAQGGRGWIEMEQHAALRFKMKHIDLEAEARLTLRRVDAGPVGGGTPIPVDQLRVEAEAAARFDDTVRLDVRGVLATYDRDLGSRALAGADLGPAIGFAVRPEAWAVEARVGRRAGSFVWIEPGLGGGAFAGGHGGAVVPRLAVRVGPAAGLTFEPAAEIAFTVGEWPREALRAIASLDVVFER